MSLDQLASIPNLAFNYQSNFGKLDFCVNNPAWMGPVIYGTVSRGNGCYHLSVQTGSFSWCYIGTRVSSDGIVELIQETQAKMTEHYRRESPVVA